VQFHHKPKYNIKDFYINLELKNQESLILDSKTLKLKFVLFFKIKFSNKKSYDMLFW